MTKLPSFLYDSHKRYKEDSNHVATWLARTAQKYGYPLKDQPSTSPLSHPPSRRLKGKARKQAREAQSAAEGSGTTDVAIRHTITVKEFTDLARWIANVKPPVKVPALILYLIRSAIELRKRCAEWFQNNGANEELEVDNLTHSHFIGVLEEVLHILEPNSVSDGTNSTHEGRHSESKTTSQNIAGAKSETGLDKLTNLYDVLSIESNALDDATPTADTATSAKNIVSSKTTPPTLPKKLYEVESTDEDLIFAFYCFFYDLHELRKFLLKLWIRYKDRSLDLMSVSVTTNTAINLVSRAEEDFFATHPILTSEFLEKIPALVPRTRGHLDNLLNNAKSESIHPFFLQTQTTLKWFCDRVQQGVPQTVIKQCGVSDLPTDQSGNTIQHQVERDQGVLILALTEIFYMTQMKSTPIADELTHGFASMVFEKTLPLWMAYAAQIFLDIYNVLGADVGRGFSELQASGTHISSVLKEYYNSSPPSTAQASKEEGFRSLSVLIDSWILGDALDHFKRKFLKLPVSAPLEAFSLFKRHPLICGLFQFQLYTNLQYHSLISAGEWGSILYMAHLYEGCRQAANLTQIWADMELVKDIHTREQIFLGRVPQTVDESLKCISLMLGVSPVSFARGTRPNRLKKSNKKRSLKFNAPVSNAFVENWMKTNNPRLMMNNLEDLLDGLGFNSISTIATARDKDQGPLQRQWAKSHKMTPLQFLDTLCHAIAAEEHMLRFDYISFHLRCVHLLRTLRTVLDDTLRHHFGPNYIEKETHLAFVVLYIFIVAGGFVKFKTGSESRILERASVVLQEFMEQKGSVECDRLHGIYGCRSTSKAVPSAFAEET
jgi:hypothetical protein